MIIMKKTQLKDALRNIWKQKGSWISIIVISALAVMACSGIDFASKAIANSANTYFNRTNFRDLEIVSTMLMTEEDLQTIKNTTGVKSAEGVFQTSGKIVSGDKEACVDVINLTKEINTPQVVSGRIPENAGECAVEKELLTKIGLSVGDSITVTDPSGDPAKYLKSNTFKITGTVTSAEHACLETVVSGSKPVFVTADAFDTEALENCYMKALVLFDDSEGLNRFGDKYFTATKDNVDELKKVAEQRSKKRFDDVSDRYESEISDLESQLADGKKKLDDARSRLDDGYVQLEKAEKDAADGKIKLENAEKALENGKKQLEDAKTGIDTDTEKLAYEKGQLDEGKKKLDDARSLLDEAEKELRGEYAKLETAKNEIDKSEKKLADEKKKLDAAKKQLDEADSELKTASRKLKTGWIEIETSKNLIRSALRSAVASFLDSQIANGSMTEEERADIESSLVWAKPKLSVDLTDDTVRAADFAVTDSLKIDLGMVKDAVPALESFMDYVVRQAQQATGDPSLSEEIKQSLDDFILQAGGLENTLSSLEESIDKMNTWDEDRAQYDDKLTQYNAEIEKYNSGKNEYDDSSSELAAGKKEYEKDLKDYQESLKNYESGKSEYLTGLADYNKKLGLYEAGVTSLEKRKADYANGETKYEDAKKEYEKALADHNDVLKKIMDSETALAEGEKEYSEGVAEYEENLDKLNVSKAEYASLDACDWVFLDPRGNSSCLFIEGAIKDLGIACLIFSLLFVSVGVIVLYAAAGRTVDERRRLDGAAKAVGLFNRALFGQSLLFGLSATVPGMLLGLAGGYFLLQKLIITIFGKFCVYGNGKPVFICLTVFIVFAAGILISSLTVFIACSNLHKTKAARCSRT